ncbi:MULTISPECIES: hypothetical protein [Brenneria]|uniref:Uncharacterized protein n=1 Tax=Brenneria nigrifluens DSM 30175 = ATCC 13028 TaxID=1121120 RepID=A0A2U1USU8_9GAMM|nr:MULTISPECIES: hypothetical protein [Brenneria]EHD21523.1 hypothetical protein BrE312_2140 [Brenneria sp. EniD312]PWC24691.1 hypothetical protein DDT54_08365 [Brenneria nigrifluens DSM 30175 = ATCC 13028]QCR04644.1 hypothetical protein EH206_10960 [Brenneria nigrifluens DSM 30175 = ATCC 13028]
MAKIVIYVRDHSRGLSVDCRFEGENGDSELAQRVAIKTAAGLAGHVSVKVNDAVKKSRKGKVNVH